MDSPSEDKQWAQKYILDPLTAPEPSQETGPGSHFITQSASRMTATSKTPSTTTTAIHQRSTSAPRGYPTPPNSASPTRSSFHPSNPYSTDHRKAAFGAYPSPSYGTVDEPIASGKGRRRGSSLGERFPGDMSHRPLDQLRKDNKAAYRAPHLKRRHMPGADAIDVLDRTTIGGAYHHEGPYDATLLARNTSFTSSPVAAVSESNKEALKATPREYIQDSLERHMPLQGTAIIPPGMAALDGRIMNYKEGADLMRELDAPGGAYRRWEGRSYHPDDLKGKGEPSYTIEKALKEYEQNGHRRIVSEGNASYEMRPLATRQRSVSGSHAEYTPVSQATTTSLGLNPPENSIQRSNTTGKKVGEGLKKRFGSLRRLRNKISDS